MADFATVALAEWLTVKEAAKRAKCSERLIYDNIKRGRLRASRLGYRKDIRILETWLHAWIVSLSEPHVIDASAPETVDTAAIPFTRRGRKPC